ncbi:MAG TPA: ABC transporter permease, partial [Bacillota bacterium]|nr:ABC transporter permease [Bacillota bacterium]
LIVLLVASLTLPLVPTIVFSFIALLIARLTARFRKTNILNIILLFVVFLGIMYLSFSLNFGEANPLLNQESFMSSIGAYYPPIKWFVGAVDDLNFGYLALLLVTNAAVFTGFIFGVQKLVKSTNQRAMTKVTRKNGKAVVSKQRSLMSSITAKEWKTFFNTPIYALNVGFGPVILFVLAIASIFYADTIKTYLGGEMNIGVSFEIIVLIIVGFVMSMIYSSAVSLSLEGKNFWILKSLPIKPKTIMYGKMLFNIILGLPVAIVSLIIFSYTFDITALTLLCMIVFTTSLSLVVSSLGSIINLFVPKFEYRNPAEVVKQSAAALFGLFGSWIILMLNGFLYWFVTKSLSSDIAILMMSMLNLILFTGMMIFIDRKTESLFIKFEV